MKNKVFAWDFDGPIINSVKFLYDWFSFASNKFNAKFPFNSIEDFASSFIEPVYPDFYEHLNFDLKKDGSDIWKEYLLYGKNNLAPLVSGIKLELKKLLNNNCFMGVASSNNSKIIHNHLLAYGLQDYFNKVVAADDLPNSNLTKPNMASFSLALRDIEKIATGDWNNSHLYAVGDQKTDLMSAKRSIDFFGKPVYFIAACYGGFGKPEDFKDVKIYDVGSYTASADFIAHSPAEISDFIINHNPSKD